MVFVDWRDLPADVRAYLDQIEGFVGDVDGIDTTTGDVVDASDAVRAVNALVPILRSALATQKEEVAREGCVPLSKHELVDDVERLASVCEAHVGRLARIRQIIETVDNRCAAADGPVTPTLKEMRQEEIGEIYSLACAAFPSPAAWNEAVEEMRELLTAAKAMLLSVGVPRRNIDDVNMVLAFYKRIDRALTRPDPTPEGR